MVAASITPDVRRRERLGFDEAVFCAGKTPAQIEHIVRTAEDDGETLLLTRLRPDQLAALAPAQQNVIEYDALSRTGYVGPVAVPVGPARVGVISAGSSDIAVAREAVRTLGYYGHASLEIHDVGVAGLWRVLDRVDEIRTLPVAIVAAGMDGALPSVLAGLVPGLVIAVPVSAGYGVAEGGRAALHAALASCAPGLLVVNIDNGYGAACGALRALNALGASGAGAT